MQELGKVPCPQWKACLFPAEGEMFPFKEGKQFPFRGGNISLFLYEGEMFPASTFVIKGSSVKRFGCSFPRQKCKVKI